MAGIKCHLSIIYVFSSLCTVWLGSTTPSIYHGRRQVPSFYLACVLCSLCMVGINNPLKLSWQALRDIILYVLSSLWTVGINNPLQAFLTGITWQHSIRSLFSLFGWDLQPLQSVMVGVKCHPSIVCVLSSLCMVVIKNLFKAFHDRRQVPSFYAFSLLSVWLGSTTPSSFYCRRPVPSFYTMSLLSGWLGSSTPWSFHGRRHVASFYAISLLSGLLGSTTPSSCNGRSHVTSFYVFSLLSVGWDINNPLKFSWQAPCDIILCVLSSLWMVGINNPEGGKV